MSGTPARTLRGALLALALMSAAPVADAVAAPSLPVPAAPAAMSVAGGLAAAHWGRQACGGQVAISWEHLGRATNAESRWSSPAGGDPGTYTRCAIAFSLDARWDWPKLCTVTEHELGHLNGHDHVDDEADVMSPYYYEPSPECATAPPAGAAPVAGTTARAAGHATSSARSRRARDRNRR